MRPVRKGDPYEYENGRNYREAFPGLVARIGLYCSYCERPIQTGLAIEHIRPKNKVPDEERQWSNFLLGCVNCNSTKLEKNPPLNSWMIPDRDNTFICFNYSEDGAVYVNSELTSDQKKKALKTLQMVGIEKDVETIRDENGNAVALDRKSQRMQAFLHAQRYLAKWETNKISVFADAIIDLAKATGFFSVWMKVFSQEPEILRRLIIGFPGTQESGCFDLASLRPITPHPNLDALRSGGKA